MKMKNAIYYNNGIKMAGDHTLANRLPEHILNAELPVVENGCLYTRLSDGSISVIEADDKTLASFTEKKPTNKRVTKSEFLKNLLYGSIGSDVKSLCSKYAFPFEQTRRVFAAELSVDISGDVATLEEIFQEDETVIVSLSAHQVAIICPEDENNHDPAEMAGAVGQTFTELNSDYHIGISCICDNASMLHEAFEQALCAIRVGRKLSYSGGVWFFSNILPELIVNGLPEEALSALKEKAEQISRSLDSETVELAQEFFRHNLNISETARSCYLHRNTLIYRLDRIQKETGFNLRNFDEAVALRLYIAANKILK